MSADDAFHVGQRVQFRPGAATRNQPYAARYTIVRQMPADPQGVSYRIRGDGENHERVALGSQLEAISFS